MINQKKDKKDNRMDEGNQSGVQKKSLTRDSESRLEEALRTRLRKARRAVQITAQFVGRTYLT